MLSVREISHRIEELLKVSPADETSVAWIERNRQKVSGHRLRSQRAPQKDILIRVFERGRLGTYRTQCDEFRDLERSLRFALAHAKAKAPIPGFPHLPQDKSKLTRVDGLFDDEISNLSSEEMANHLRSLARSEEWSTLTFSESRVVVMSSAGVRRRSKVTEIDLAVRCGSGVGFGYATGAARSLGDFDLEEIFDRARWRRVEQRDLDTKVDPRAPILLAPEAAAQFFSVLGRVAFTAQSYQNGDSFLREHLGVQVFDRNLSIVDDGTDPEGLPFLFDLEGTAKRPVPLIHEGIPKTPALDQAHSGLLGLPATPHAWSGDDARPEHLFVLPGDLSDAALIEASEGGLRVSILERLECFDARRVKIRAVARGVRHVRGGKLGPAAPDFVWETSLLQTLGQLGGLGNRRRRIADPSSLLGSICSPALLLNGSLNLRPLTARGRSTESRAG